MKKHLFLCGPLSRDNARILEEELGPAIAMAGGYITRRVLDENGRLLGCDLLPAAAAAGIEGFEPLRFLDCGTTPPTKNNEVFRGPAVQLLKEAEFYPFSVIYEFGGLEILIPQFREQLAEFLSSEQPCIGVLKDEADSEELRQSFGLGEKYSMLAARLHEALGEDCDTVLLKTGGHEDETARRIVRQWVREFVYG